MNRAARSASEIYDDVLRAVKADRLVMGSVKRGGSTLSIGELSLDLSEYESVYVVGAGKAATGMAQAIESVLGDTLTEGVVVTKSGHSGPTRRITMLEASHPVLDATSIAAGEAIHSLALRAGTGDLVLCLLSGGASALLELPAAPVTLADLQHITTLLLRAGADINELNTVRGCLSNIKAGGLARAATPAKLVCLVLSDVLGNPLDVIGSGPCVDTPVHPDRALEILERYHLLDGVAPSIRERLSMLSRSPAVELVAPADHVIVGDIWTALRAAERSAQSLGLRPLILTGNLQGEAREVAKLLGGIAADLPDTRRSSGYDCFILGGETTVTVRGDGRGGRCQEIGCAAIPLLNGIRDVALLAGGTDGSDGPTDAAGSLVTGETGAIARSLGLDPASHLATSDTYPILDAVGALLRTGPTHSNVGDIVLLVTSSGE